MGDDEWLKLYLDGMSQKIDALAVRIEAHMAKDLAEHEAIRKDLGDLKLTIVRWILVAAAGAGAGTAGITKAVAAILGS